MKQAPLLIAAGIFSFFSASLHAESALEIATKFERQKIEALEAYLEGNPDATDKAMAYEILIDAHTNIGENEAILGLIEKRYELLETGAAADLQLIATEIARPYVQAALASGEKEKGVEFLSRLESDLSNHPQGPQFAQFLSQVGAELHLPGVGDTMDISFTSMSGEEIDLSAMDDKVVLVDFWATWCQPCVAEMPHVVAAYEEYKGQGFEVIGISLDENREAVEAFVEQYNMDWPQYFDGKGWQNDIAQKFGISSIPATFLIGKDGKIIASNLRGEALDQAVVSALQ